MRKLACTEKADKPSLVRLDTKDCYKVGATICGIYKHGDTVILTYITASSQTYVYVVDWLESDYKLRNFNLWACYEQRKAKIADIKQSDHAD